MEITSKIIRELLHYDTDTGVFTWRRRDLKWFGHERDCKRWNNRYAGKTAGSLHTKPNGYQFVEITLFKRPYKAHRVAWLYVTGSWPSDGIDHINRNPTDNRFVNLREATTLENGHNQSRYANNKSGVSGIFWNKRARKWYVSCGLNGVRHYLGTYQDFSCAKSAVDKFRSDNGFDDSHGAQSAPYLMGA